MYENVSCLVIFFSFAFKLKVILASSFQDCWMNEGQLENSRALEKVIVFHYGHKTSRRLLRINICMSQIRFALNQIMDWGYRALASWEMINSHFFCILQFVFQTHNSHFFCLTSSWAPFRADQLIGSRPPPRHTDHHLLPPFYGSTLIFDAIIRQLYCGDMMRQIRAAGGSFANSSSLAEEAWLRVIFSQENPDEDQWSNDQSWKEP